ncbi:Copia protein [Ceratocystis lukuohia]|uniref:Copia protein n=1 Tax=Ceratocystis lukuohia TaxID=2019550 RepID=A0ABR4MU40_9PEZI
MTYRFRVFKELVHKLLAPWSSQCFQIKSDREDGYLASCQKGADAKSMLTAVRACALSKALFAASAYGVVEEGLYMPPRMWLGKEEEEETKRHWTEMGHLEGPENQIHDDEPEMNHEANNVDHDMDMEIDDQETDTVTVEDAQLEDIDTNKTDEKIPEQELEITDKGELSSSPLYANLTRNAERWMVTSAFAQAKLEETVHIIPPPRRKRGGQGTISVTHRYTDVSKRDDQARHCIRHIISFTTHHGSSREAFGSSKARSQMKKSAQTINPRDSTLVYGDNQAALKVANNLGASSKTKHTDVQYQAIKEWIREGSIKPEYVSTGKMLADGLTK